MPHNSPSSSLSNSDNSPKLLNWQVRIVVLSFFSYFFYYFTRKNLGVAAPDMIDNAVFGADTKKIIGWVQTGYLLVYMIGQFLSGMLGDKTGARMMIFTGMLLSSLASICIGFFPFISLFLVLWSLNGLFQSTGWSNNCKLITAWIPHQQRGRVMGFWAGCYVLGSISANFVAGYFLKDGWQTVFLVTGVSVLVIAIIQGLFLVNDPKDKGFHIERRNGSGKNPNDSSPAQSDFWKIIKNPIILTYGGCYFSLKFIRYTFFGWLPWYLYDHLNYKKDMAAYVSVSFEVGGIIGLVIGGVFADKFFSSNRGKLAWIGLIGLSISLFAFKHLATADMVTIVISLATVGLFLYIADSIISGTAAQDVGGAENAAAATGVVNGIGSIGGALSGIVPVLLEEAYGWNSVFYLFIALSIGATLLLIPVARKKHVTKA